MRPLVFTGLGIGFMLMGVALFALTLRKPKPPAGTAIKPTKSQIRELATLAEENRKMRVAAGVSAGFGVVLVFLTFI